MPNEIDYTEFEIANPGERPPRITGILWGSAKVGKTTLLMSSPGKKLIANFDPDGHESVGYRNDYKVLDFTQYPPDEQIRLARDRLPTMIEQSDDFGPGDTLLVDSLSSFAYAGLLTAIKKEIGKGQGFSPSLEAPGLSAYGARTQYVIQLTRNCLRATARKGMHCWFTAHMDTPTTDPKGNFLYQTLTLSDKAVNETGLAISEIWFMDKAETANKSRFTIAVSPIRGRKPMGSRMFRTDDIAEFDVAYDPYSYEMQEDSIDTWFNMWLAGGKNKLPTPGTAEFAKLYKAYAKTK